MEITEKICVVEDEPALREAIVYNLETQGYQVIAAQDGRTAISLVLSEKPDLLLLDLMLPGVDGFEVCRQVRRSLNLPIIILTARSGEIDRVLGLEMGADDYIVKPFSMRELLSRVKAQLRRVKMVRDEMDKQLHQSMADSNHADENNTMTFGTLVIDPLRREVLYEGKVVALKPKEYDLLTYLAQHRRAALSRDKILRDVWGWEYSGGTRTVDVHMRWLRAKIESDPANPTRIVTVHGVGYRFEG